MNIAVIGMFCEDIREEKTGQVSLVGILPDTIALPAPPLPQPANTSLKAVLPKLGLYVRIRLPLDSLPQPIILKVELPGENPITLGAANGDIVTKSLDEAHANKLPYAGVVINAVMQGIQTVGGVIKASIEYQNETQDCAFLNVLPFKP